MEKDELEKHLLENTNSVYMLWEKYTNIFRYFDDWILCLPDETMRKCEKVVMRKKQENGKRMETCDWLICQTKQEEREKNILTLIRAFQRNGFSVEKIVKEIMEGFQLTHDEANSYMEKALDVRGEQKTMSGIPFDDKCNLSAGLIERGEERGFKRGEESGFKRGKEELTVQMLKENLPIEQISRITKLPIAKLQEIQNMI